MKLVFDIPDFRARSYNYQLTRISIEGEIIDKISAS